MSKSKKRIGWDVTHLEFTIEDHYYFSKLKSNIKNAGGVVREVKDFNDLEKYDVIVFNYPETPFNKSQVKIVKRLIESGKRAVITGYYDNEDRIADNINTLSSPFGLNLRTDIVKDNFSNEEGDDLLIVTSRISQDYKNSVKKVMLPCTASISMNGSFTEPLILKEKTNLNSKRDVIVGAVANYGDGEFILIGTCVFWDNFAISRYSNLNFSLNLLQK